MYVKFSEQVLAHSKSQILVATFIAIIVIITKHMWKSSSEGMTHRERELPISSCLGLASQSYILLPEDPSLLHMIDTGVVHKACPRCSTAESSLGG